MDGTIIGQGSFIVPATIVNQVIAIPCGVDWLSVRNYTQTATAGVAASGSVGYEFYWQRGMPAGSAFVKYKQVTTNASTDDLILSGGFTLYDPSGQTQGAQPLLGPAVSISVATDATRPIITHTADTNVAVGTVVRLSNTAQSDVNGIDMVVGTVTDSTHFTLLTSTNALATTPGMAGGANGFYRIVYNGNSALFYPRRRVITNINKTTSQVSTAIAHGLTPGQEVRFNIPVVSGMTQLNPNPLNNYYPTGTSTPAIVTSVVDDYNFIINIDCTAYTAFTYPTVAQQPSSFPEVTPFGEDTATALSSITSQVPTIGGIQIYNTNTGILADSTVNTGFMGMVLGTGGAGVQLTTAITGPAGAVAADVVYWRAGKSTFGGL